MKRLFRILLVLIAYLVLTTINSISMAQPPPPPQHGLANNSVPGAAGAPIGDGLFFLLGLTVLYGSIKVYSPRNRLKRIGDDGQKDIVNRNSPDGLLKT